MKMVEHDGRIRYGIMDVRMTRLVKRRQSRVAWVASRDVFSRVEIEKVLKISGSPVEMQGDRVEAEFNDNVQSKSKSKSTVRRPGGCVAGDSTGVGEQSAGRTRRTHRLQMQMQRQMQKQKQNAGEGESTDL
jgi:hypothetical protein